MSSPEQQDTLSEEHRLHTLKEETPAEIDISAYQAELQRNVYGSIAFGGVYLGYFVDLDTTLSDAERKVLTEYGGYKDEAPDYKIHLSPKTPMIKRTAALAINACQQDSSLRAALYQMKFWAAPEPPEPDEPAPRIILYPRNGSVENVYKIVKSISPILIAAGIEGSGAIPRFNHHIHGDLWYIAQGSGSDKTNDPAYRDIFSSETNWAFLHEHVESAQSAITKLNDELK